MAEIKSSTAAPSRRLTERETEVLNELRSWNYGERWARPMDVGGSNGSHHSATLAKLVRLGYAESKQRSAWMSRGSKVYRAKNVEVIA